MAGSRRKLWNAVIVGGLALAVGAFLVIRRQRQYAVTASHRVDGAWYARTPSPVLVVEHATYVGPYSDPDDSRRSRDAKTTISYHSHRIEDGAHLGSFQRDGWKVPVAGVWKDRVWVCGGGEPALLAAEGLTLVADRAAIRKAIAGEVGGDFELSGVRCYVDAYTGRLAIKGADGKRHWLTTDLRVEPHTSDAVDPPGYDCALHDSELFKPRVALCMAPDAGPANQLVLSRPSALAKDAGKPEVLSGVSASDAGGTRVLWTKPLTALTQQPDPRWLGARPLEPGRVAVLIGSAELRVHVLELDPADGTVKASKVLFDRAAPGT